jgi:putative flippase GtrA
MFVFVGGFAFVAHYSVLIGLVEGGIAPPVAAALMAFVAGGIVSYVLNRRLTFRSSRRHLEAAPSFAGVALVGFGLTGAFMYLFVERLGLPYLPAQLVTTGVVLLWTFTANKLWTFRERKA